MQSRSLVSLIVTVLALLVFAPAQHAEAQRHFRRGGSMYVGGGLGPFVYFDLDTGFRIQGEFGIHPGGDDTGFFVAFEAVPTFSDDFVMFYGGVRLGGDIEVFTNRDLGVILRPSGLFGGGLTDFDYCRGVPRCDDTFGLFVFQPAFDVRFALANRVFQLWLRPMSFDILVYPDINDDVEVDVGYAFLGGADFTF